MPTMLHRLLLAAVASWAAIAPACAQGGGPTTASLRVVAAGEVRIVESQPDPRLMAADGITFALSMNVNGPLSAAAIGFISERGSGGRLLGSSGVAGTTLINQAVSIGLDGGGPSGLGSDGAGSQVTVVLAQFN